MQEASRHTRAYALVGVLLATLWPSLVNLIGRSGDLTSVASDLRTIVTEWAVVLILAAIAFGPQRLDRQFFRISMFRGRDLLVMLGWLIATLLLAGAIGRFVTPPAFDLQRIAAVPIGVRAILVITAGICEEFMFRGFVIQEIGFLTGNRKLGAVLSIIFFGLGHVGTYGLSSALLIPTLIGAMITLLYMWRNNLPLCMLMHATIDGIVVLLVPGLVRG